MTTAIIVYFLISCLMVYYFWSDIGWKKNSWKPYVFLSGHFSLLAYHIFYRYCVCNHRVS